MTYPLARDRPAAADGTMLVDVAAPMRLWLVRLDRASSPDEVALLSSWERDRATRYVFEGDRARYLRAHVVLRLLIERETGIDRAEQRLEPDDLGKPRLVDTDWQFNISYAQGVAVVAVARGAPIGVDIEAIRPIGDATDLAALYFDDEEQRRLAAIGDWYSRSHAFLAGWTRKEACLKVTGAGLRHPARLLATGLDRGPAIVRGQGIVTEVASFSPAPGLVAAWARRIPDA